MNKHIINKRKEVIASERYIKFIIKHQNKLHKRYYSSNVPKKYKVVNVLRARKLLYKNVYEEWKYIKMNVIYHRDCLVDGLQSIKLKEEVDVTMGAIYEVLPLYKGEMVVEKQTVELEEKYFNFIKELIKKIPEWGLM